MRRGKLMLTSHRATRKLPNRKLLFAVPQGHKDDFAALLDAYHDNGIEVQMCVYNEGMPDARNLAAEHPGLDALLLAGPARFAPRTALPGPFVANSNGKLIPAAWLPIKNAATNRRFAQAAARVQQRARQRSTVALLSQWHPKYLRMSDRLEALLQQPVQTFRWTGDVISRDGLVDALSAGLGMALYVGHGRPIGWVGYFGMRIRHFEGFAGEPLGALLSLCCRTASRRRTGLSYAEALPLMGVAASSFAAVMETRHTDNTRWAVRICESLAAGADTLGELIVRAAPSTASASTPYRLIGDPLAPLLAEAAGAKRAAAVTTYP